MIKKIYNFFTNNCDVSIFSFFLKTFYCFIRGKRIYTTLRTRIDGLQNIDTHGSLIIGKGVERRLRSEQSWLSVLGEMKILGKVYLGRGSRVFVAKGAVCQLEDCVVTGNIHIIAHHKVEIGSGSLISWDCEFMDDDHHFISYPGKREKPREIIIGKKVWIGSGVKILKGVHIGDGSVIAAGSVVTSSFPSGVLIGGNPACLLRENVIWGERDEKGKS